jgi:hypothetical protein
MKNKRIQKRYQISWKLISELMKSKHPDLINFQFKNLKSSKKYPKSSFVTLKKLKEYIKNNLIQNIDCKNRHLFIDNDQNLICSFKLKNSQLGVRENNIELVPRKIPELNCDYIYNLINKTDHKLEVEDVLDIDHKTNINETLNVISPANFNVNIQNILLNNLDQFSSNFIGQHSLQEATENDLKIIYNTVNLAFQNLTVTDITDINSASQFENSKYPQPIQNINHNNLININADTIQIKDYYSWYKEMIDKMT